MGVRARAPGSGEVHPLEHDRGLREAIPQRYRRAAARGLLTSADRLDPGPWPRAELADPATLGILVLSGLIVRRVELDGTRSSELIGPGDLLRPWDVPGASGSSLAEISWAVVAEAHLARLDRRFLQLTARWPDLAGEALQRIQERTRRLGVQLAIANARGATGKVRLLFTHLSATWGVDDPRGLLCPFALSHALIGELIGARRESVSRALSELRRRGELERVEGGWLIPGAGPINRRSVRSR